MSIQYFAYGSNLNAEDLRAWCEQKSKAVPHLKVVGPAVLPDYELRFGRHSHGRKDGVLDVWPARGYEVPGVLFEVSDGDLFVLDRKEGHPNAYQRQTVLVRKPDGSAVHAITYVGLVEDREPFERPDSKYLDVVRQGWRAHGLAVEVLNAAAGIGDDRDSDSPPRTSPVCSSLFVYGTLLRGESRAHLLRDLRPSSWLLAETRGEIVDCGDYPGLVTTNSDCRLLGELVVFDEEAIEAALDVLDEVEGYEGFGRPGNWFERRLIDVHVGDGRIREAWAYFLAKPIPEHARIPENDWRALRGRRAQFIADLARKHVDGLSVERVMADVTSRPWTEDERLLAIHDAVDLARALTDGVLDERRLAQATGRWVVV